MERSFMEDASQASVDRQTQERPASPQVDTQDWMLFAKRILTYAAILLVGTTIVYYIFVNTTLQAVSNAIPGTSDLARALDTGIARIRESVNEAGIGGLLVSNSGMVVIAVVTLIVLAILTHLLMRIVLRGKGSVNEQVSVILGVYNRWLPIQYILLAIGAALAWSALPQSLCLFVPAIGVALYAGAIVPARIGTAYDKSARAGCIAYVGAIILFSVITGGFFAVLFNALIFALDYHF
jgi:hypothetical protein